MELEAEVKVTLHVKNDHFVHGRAVVRIDNGEIFKLAGWVGNDPPIGANNKKEYYRIIIDEMYDLNMDLLERLNGLVNLD